MVRVAVGIIDPYQRHEKHAAGRARGHAPSRHRRAACAIVNGRYAFRRLRISKRRQRISSIWKNWPDNFIDWKLIGYLVVFCPASSSSSLDRHALKPAATARRASTARWQAFGWLAWSDGKVAAGIGLILPAAPWNDTADPSRQRRLRMAAAWPARRPGPRRCLMRSQRALSAHPAPLPAAGSR